VDGSIARKLWEARLNEVLLLMDIFAFVGYMVFPVEYVCTPDSQYCAVWRRKDGE